MKYLKYLFDTMMNDIESTAHSNIDSEILNIKASAEIIYYFIDLLDTIITKNTENMLKIN
jgi:hypothetical protein